MCETSFLYLLKNHVTKAILPALYSFPAFLSNPRRPRKTWFFAVYGGICRRFLAIFWKGREARCSEIVEKRKFSENMARTCLETAISWCILDIFTGTERGNPFESRPRTTPGRAFACPPCRTGGALPPRPAGGPLGRTGKAAGAAGPAQRHQRHQNQNREIHLALHQGGIHPWK